MAKIVLKSKEKTSISDFLKPVIKWDADTRVSFIIKDQICKVIMGMDHSIRIVSLDTENEWLLKNGAWSLSASSFKQCWIAPHTKEYVNENFEITIKYFSKKCHPHVDTLAENGSRIYIQAKEAIPEHLDFLMFTEHAKQHTMSTASAKEVINAADILKPFDSFEINKAKAQIRIEHEEVITPYALPETLAPEFDLLLNKESLEAFTRLCESTKSDTVSIYTDDERAVFSDGNNVESTSLLSLRDYANKKEANYTIEQKIVISIYDLKKEVESYRNMTLVKKANEALLYIDSNCVMLAGLTPETGGNCFLSAQHISETSPTVYRINLSALSKVKISDITTAKQIKLQMLLDQNRKRKLGFYNGKNSVHPNECVHDIELAPEKMNEVINAKIALEETIKTKGGEGDDAKQGDLLGFDDI